LIAQCVKPFFIFRNGSPCCVLNITARTKSVAVDHPKHCAWGGLHLLQLLKNKNTKYLFLNKKNHFVF